MSTRPVSIHVCGLSRSGTTLLAAMLDAHPQVSMAYEIVPPALGPLDELLSRIQGAIDGGESDPRRIGRSLSESGHPALGRLVKHADRANVPLPMLLEVCERLRDEGVSRVDSTADRERLASAIVMAKMRGEGTCIGGHKIGPESCRRRLKESDRTRVAYILRNPLDVAASQIERGFAVTPKSLSRQWNRLARSATRLVARLPRQAVLVRYEDLVRRPEIELGRILEIVGIPFDSIMLHPGESKASVLRSRVRHVNHDRLGGEISEQRIDRGIRELDPSVSRTIIRRCRRWGRALGYQIDGSPPLSGSATRSDG